jgi:predicted Zn-dependent peptidase
VAAVTAEALPRGTETRAGRVFTAAAVRAGGSLRTTPGFDHTEISVVTGRGQVEAALRLIADVVAHPRFDPQEVAAAREIVKRRLAGIRDDFTGASYQSLAAELYLTTPYGRPISGFVRTLDRLDEKQVRAFWRRCYVQHRICVGIAGDVDPAQALTVAQKAFGDVPYARPLPSPPVPQEVLREPRLEFIQRPGPAAQLMFGFLCPPVTRAEYPVYAVLEAALGGGKQSRLFTQVRDRHGLGYDLGAFYTPLRGQSHLVAYIVLPPFVVNERTGEQRGQIDRARELMLQEFRGLAAAPLADAELSRARNYALGRALLRQERTLDQARRLALAAAGNLGPDFDTYFAERVLAVTKEEVLGAAKRCLTQYALVVTVPVAS